MKLLLDTHAVIWWVDQDHLLSPTAHAAISDPANEILLSAGTIWEIAIKVGLAKLTLSPPYRQWLEQAIVDLEATVLLYIDTRPPYAEQEIEELGDDDVIARLNPVFNEIENLKVVLFFSTRLLRNDLFELPVIADLRVAVQS